MPELVYKYCLLTLMALFVIKTSSSQSNPFERCKDYTVSVGTVTTDTFVVDNKKVYIRNYKSVGSGLATYVNYQQTSITTIITAKHVLRNFIDNKIDTVWIRFSWADTIPTTDYYGIPHSLKKTFHIWDNDESVDLSCLELHPENDPLLVDRINNGFRISILPRSRIQELTIGRQVYAFGYTANSNLNQFFYNFCTFKTGIITWAKNVSGQSLLNNLYMIESNASFGNSGGPVFAILDNGEFLFTGVLVAGLNDVHELKFKGAVVRDSATNSPFYIDGRAGVTQVIKASVVRKFLDDITIEVNKQ